MSVKELAAFNASRVLGFASRAVMVGFNIDLGIMLGEGVVAGFNMVADVGASARNNAPGVTRSQYYSGGIAATMRQASLAAIQASQMGGRPYMGDEARVYHG
jgi:hypothetical protein